MKIILAPDKFKGCMKSPQVCEILRRAFKEEFPEAEILSLPMADGGEGTVEALLSASGGELRCVRVSGPTGKEVEAQFGLYNNAVRRSWRWPPPAVWPFSAAAS
jgi:glycerate kinase